MQCATTLRCMHDYLELQGRQACRPVSASNRRSQAGDERQPPTTPKNQLQSMLQNLLAPNSHLLLVLLPNHSIPYSSLEAKKQNLKKLRMLLEVVLLTQRLLLLNAWTHFHSTLRMSNVMSIAPMPSRESPDIQVQTVA